MDTRARLAGLRLFQSFDSHQQRGRLFDLSWPHRSNAGRFTDTVATDGMVFGMSPCAGKLCATEDGHFQYGMEATRGSEEEGW